MPGHRLTQSEYTLQQVVEHVGYLLFALKEQNSTHICRVVIHFCELKNIDYLVLQYSNTGALPFEGFSEEWLFP